MHIIDYFQSYIHYLIHPYKTHDAFMGKETGLGYKPHKMSVYESLGASWIFIVINGIVKIFLINFVIFAFLKISDIGPKIFSSLSNEDGFIGFYFIILSTILDIIFYPLFVLFLIQFWEFIIKIFARLLGHVENVDEKARSIMTVALSSHIFVIVPILGSLAQKLSAMILMYAGLRKQLNASPALSICIMLVPILLFIMLFSLVMLIMVMRLQ